MRKSKMIAGLLTIALCVSPCGNITWQAPAVVNAETQETGTMTSQDRLSEYRLLEDGTVSIVFYFGKPEAVTNDDSEDNILTFPDEIDGRTVSGIEGTALDDNYAATSNSNKVVLPRGLRTLDVEIFRDCYYLAEINVAESNESFCTVDGVLYNKEQTELIRVPGSSGSLADFKVPETVKEIGDDAFYNSMGDISIFVSKNVEKIGDYAFYRYLGSDGSVTFTVDGENSHFIAENGSLYSKDKKVLYRYSGRQEETDESGESAEDPWGLGMSTNYTFDIPQGVTTIGTAAFQGCVSGSGFDMTGLTQVTIPDSVTTIGASAFEGCTLLGDAFAALMDGGSTEVVVPDSVTSIGESAFDSCGMSSVVLPKGLKEIADGSFYNCSYLSDIAIPEGVVSIGNAAFYSTGLSEITLPGGLRKIGMDAFGNTSLTEITIPDQVESLGDGALADCGSLTKVTIGKGLKQVGSLVCCNCTALTDIVIPEGVETIGEQAFVNCTALTRVTIPNSVTTIGEQAFGWYLTTDEETNEGKWVLVDGFTICCTASSAAEKYATDNSITAKVSEQMPSSTPSQTPSQQPDASTVPSQTPSQQPDASTVPDQSPSQQPDVSAAPSQAPTEKPDATTAPSQAPAEKPDASTAPSAAPSNMPVPTSSAPGKTSSVSSTPAPVKPSNVDVKVTAPSAVKLTAVKNIKGKKLQITWKKNAKAAGYEVQYATSAKFKSAGTVTVKSAKTTKTVIKKLKKGKKYFVRVRAYVTAGSGKKYSKWSSVKKAVIKK